MAKWTWRVAILWPCIALSAMAGEGDFAAVLKLTPDVKRGEELFARCAPCHGATATGERQAFTPRLAGQHYRVLVRQFLGFRNGDRWDRRMENVAAEHAALPEAQDLADVAAYVSRLTRDGVRNVGDGRNLPRGRELFTQQCASCHGARGEGDDAREVPRLAGQDIDYLERQMYDAMDARRRGMAESHRERLAPLSQDEVQGIADYLARRLPFD
jgi:cytochrome c553